MDQYSKESFLLSGCRNIKSQPDCLLHVFVSGFKRPPVFGKASTGADISLSFGVTNGSCSSCLAVATRLDSPLLILSLRGSDLQAEFRTCQRYAWHKSRNGLNSVGLRSDFQLLTGWVHGDFEM